MGSSERAGDTANPSVAPAHAPDSSSSDWLPQVYDELRRVARRALAGERAGHTLQTTALVNEAFLKLHDHRAPWRDRVHFFAAAATAMRRILVDHARGAGRRRRGGGLVAVTLDTASAAFESAPLDVLDLDRALEALAREDARKARVVELFYFAGLDYAEIAQAEGISPVTAKRDLQFARAWLCTALS